MEAIAIGAVAPDFELEDNREQKIKLSNLRGKKVLLSWHPLAWTSVCTDQMRALENNLEAFERLNTVPLGLSVDPAPSKRAWSAAILVENVSLPSDFWPHGKVASDYGIFDQQEGISGRANFIIDENGIVRWVKVYPLHELPDIQEVLEALAEMR